jgi:hypothetical protein
MRNYEDFLKIECRVLQLKNITEELFNIRENFCSRNCRECVMHQNYYHLGLSCNSALDKYPEETKKLMEV